MGGVVYSGFNTYIVEFVRMIYDLSSASLLVTFPSRYKVVKRLFGNLKITFILSDITTGKLDLNINNLVNDT